VIGVLAFLYNKYLKNSYELSDLINFGGGAGTDVDPNDMTPKYYLSMTSLARLNDVDPVLIKIFKEAIKQSPYDFGIASGYRSTEEQQKLYSYGRYEPYLHKKIVTYADGVNKKSYHQTGKAVDIYAYIDGKASWDAKYYEPIARHIQNVAQEFGVDLEWGGDWTRFKDLPHFQI
jgi:peptidoglycan L-alanyl-D-glutamate endopeptidase CwlK